MIYIFPAVAAMVKKRPMVKKDVCMSMRFTEDFLEIAEMF